MYVPPLICIFSIGMHKVGSAPDSDRLQGQDLLPMSPTLPKCSTTASNVDCLDGEGAEDHGLCKMHVYLAS
jgi:hypothetical protein